MTDKPLMPEERCLVHFYRIVLCRYRSRPDLFRVQEDDIGGEVAAISGNTADDSQPLLPCFRVRFGFRRLLDDKVCVAAFAPDLEKLPESEQLAWAADSITSTGFASPDDEFERWSQRYLKGSWNCEDGPIRRLEQELLAIQALTEVALGKKLFSNSHNPALRYPVAENSEAFTLAHLELFRLVVDGLSLDVLKTLATKLKKIDKLPKPPKTLNSLKAVLPSELHKAVYGPLQKSWELRCKIHGVPSRPAHARAAFSEFHQHLQAICAAIVELRKWLEQALCLSGVKCLRREQAMKHFPKFDRPLVPEFKHNQFQKAVGKTITKIEAGECNPDADCHRREAIVLHFTDGTALAIDVGSNAGNLAAEFRGLDASMFSTDLIPKWAPDPRV